MAALPKYFYFKVRVGRAKIALEDCSDKDVEEVVRCRDCVHGEVDDQDWPNQYFCHYYGNIWDNESHYCSHGERRAE